MVTELIFEEFSARIKSCAVKFMFSPLGTVFAMSVFAAMISRAGDTGALDFAAAAQRHSGRTNSTAKIK